MAMTIMNNNGAMLTLGQLNKNISKVGKELKKVSSGMKLNSAGDDASGYAISEKMRVQIRGLEQDVQNVQNGKSLLRVAAGGIDNIVDELRNLKELALNAANDHNTDLDRAAIQKEFSQRTANIDDIASTTNYNGRILLNGDYSLGVEAASWIGYPDFISNSIENLCSNFTPYEVSRFGGSTVKLLDKKCYFGGKICSSVFELGSSDPAAIINPGAWSGVFDMGYLQANFINTTGVIKLDFSGATVGGSPANYPYDFDQQGFSIMCERCNLCVNIKFDASKGVNESSYNPYPLGPDPRDDYGDPLWAREYIIGIKDVVDESSLEEAVFEGIVSAPERVDLWKLYIPGGDYEPGLYYGGSQDYPNDVCVDPEHVIRIAKTSEGIFFTRYIGPWTGIYDEGYMKTLEEDENAIEGVGGKPLIIHTGTKANQNIAVSINSMKARVLHIDRANVQTREQAAKSISIIDGAITYALNSATTIGAYISRLDFTEANLITANESTQASESTIRDADMAKAMTEYTKSNVLAQASQSMLAQANQTSASVLSLLQ